MEHQLSAFYDVTHGVGLAILTPSWMRYILKKDPTCAWRFVRFARNVWGMTGDDEEKLAWDSIDALEAFFRESGIPMTLTELGIGQEHFEDMAAQANANGRLQNAFVPLDNDDIMQILKDCL